MNKEEFREERRSGLGGSDVAAILGLHPWKSAYNVYCEKLGIVEPIIDNDSIWLGTVLEPELRKRYAKITGFQIQASGRMRRHSSPRYNFAMCHPDGYVNANGDGRGLVECKYSGLPRVDTEAAWHDLEVDEKVKSWGPAGTDFVPQFHLCQGMWELGIYPDRDWCDYPVLLGAPRPDFRIYRVMPDAEFIEIMLEKGYTFWHDHVLAEIPPSVDSSYSCKRALAQMYPEDTGESVEMTPEMEKLAFSHIEFKQDIKNAEAYLQGFDNEIKAYLGDATIMENHGFKVTWKKTKDRNTTDWSMVVDGLVTKYSIPQDELMGIVEANTETKSGYRQFLVKPIKEKK